MERLAAPSFVNYSCGMTTQTDTQFTADLVDKAAKALVRRRFPLRRGTTRATAVVMLQALADVSDATCALFDAELSRLRTEEQMSYQAIANSLGLTRQAVQQRLAARA